MKKALLGAGGFAREVKASIGDFEMKCFVDDTFYIPNNENISPLSEFNPYEYEVLIGIGDSNQRENMVKKLPKETKYFTFIHPSVIILGGDVKIGQGSFIGVNSILTINIEIGSHSILNRGNHIGHDTYIGNYFSAMPGSIISGNCNIGNRVYIGTNASVKQKIKICDDVTIGLNSGVVKDINESGVYVGSPSKKIK